MLPAVLPRCSARTTPGELTVIVVDDCSTDGTAEVAAALGGRSRAGRGRTLRVLAGAPLPPGWASKVSAMAQGLAHATADAPAHAGQAENAAGELRAVHRRRHRLAPGRAAGPGPRGRGQRPGPGLADGAAAHRDRVGAGGGPGVRVLLRPALPVPAGELDPVPHRGGGRRLHAGAPRGPGALRRAGARSAAPASTTWPSARSSRPSADAAGSGCRPRW